MHRKSIFLFLFGVALCVAGHISAAAQTAPVSGTVELLKADGKTREPVAGALVEVYRMDIKTGFPSTKTDAKGQFHFAGMMLGAKYGFAVSAPGCGPKTFSDVKAGQEKLLITLLPGDGRKLTEDEARQVLAAAGKPNGAAELSAADKKAQEELDKKNAAIIEKNKNMQAADEIARKSNEEGKAALKAENYDLAISKFDEGITAVPDFIGSTPILLNGKALALKAKGYKSYREGVAVTDMEARKAKYDEANKSFDDGIAAFKQAMGLVKAAPAATEPADTKYRVALQGDLYGVAIEIYRLKAAGGVDYSKAAESAAVINDYLAYETDPLKKITAQKTLGDIMRLDGDFEKAVAAYRQVLAAKPDDAEAMAKLGLSLMAQGAAASPEDKEKEQEGLNYMQKYTEIAPITASDSASDKELKQSVKDAVDYLKAQKIAPQKVATPPKKKP